MLNVAVSEVILNEPRIRALVGQGEAASMAQHVRMGKQGKGSAARALYFRRPAPVAVQRLALLTDKERLAGRLHRARSFSHALIAAARRRVRAASSIARPSTGETCNTRLSVSTWSEFHPAGFRDAEAVPEHQEQQATVAGLVPAALGRLDQPFNLAPGQVLPVAVVPARVSCFCARSSFCREFPPSKAPETRVNRGRGLFNYRRNETFCRRATRRARHFIMRVFIFGGGVYRISTFTSVVARLCGVVVAVVAIAALALTQQVRQVFARGMP